MESGQYLLLFRTSDSFITVTMIAELLASGIALGVVSSFHCVGMCGAIAFALPVHHLPQHQKVMGIALYNLGRIAVYALLGCFFGFVGRQFFVGGMQQWFSIMLGILLLSVVLVPLVVQRQVRLQPIVHLQNRLQNFIASYIQKKQLYVFFLIGMANGLLPCGMVYFAITGAMAAGSIQGGVVFMAAFGLGTLPLMMLLSYFGFVLSIATRNTLKKSIPFFMAGMAVLLILRGMNLGIPYVSPHLQNTGASAISCH